VTLALQPHRERALILPRTRVRAVRSSQKPPRLLDKSAKAALFCSFPKRARAHPEKEASSAHRVASRARQTVRERI
jgi:hypothetical protein